MNAEKETLYCTSQIDNCIILVMKTKSVGRLVNQERLDTKTGKEGEFAGRYYDRPLPHHYLFNAGIVLKTITFHWVLPRVWKGQETRINSNTVS